MEIKKNVKKEEQPIIDLVNVVKEFEDKRVNELLVAKLNLMVRILKI